MKNILDRAAGRSTGMLTAGFCCAVILAGLWPAGGRAAEASADADSKSADQLSEIVVVGTNIASKNDHTLSPVAVIGASELQHQGTARAEDLLNSMPQLNSGLMDSSNGAGVSPVTGTATADLRGIGSFNTLVLMNGRRLTPGDSINPSPDLNSIPTALIKRVEVLTGGASSIYGSDAVAGVVNFVMDTSFTGAKFNADYGLNRATNDDSFIQGIQRASGITPPHGSVTDGRNVDLSGVYGTDLFGGAGHIIGYVGYRHSQGIFGSSRDFSACTLQETATSYQCMLDGTTPGGQFVPNGGTGPNLTLDRASGNNFRPYDGVADAYNPAPYQTLARPDTRYTAGFFGHYQFSQRADGYVEGSFSDDHTTVMYEPSGTTATGAGLNTFGINCNNPLLSPGELNALCTQYGLGPNDTAQVAIGRRNVEGGYRQDDFRHRSFRFLAGVKGAISDSWTYDVDAHFGRTDSHERLSNDISQQRLANALDVVNVSGVATCQSVVNGTDPRCIPYNIFALGGVTPQALNYIAAGGGQDGYAYQYVVDAKVVGDLGKYGIKSPFSNDAFSLAAGTAYRAQTISNQPDQAYLTGDLLATGAARSTLGTYRVGEAFAEMRIPLLQDRPFAKELSLDISDRFAQYSPQGSANAHSFGVEWAPADFVRFRGTLSRAIRAPNGHELFLSESLQQTGIADRCANDPVTGVPSASAADCARSGVTAAQYGKIPSAAGVNVLTGGNPNLKPAIADTVTAGIVLTPVELSRTLYLSVDYWRIKVNKYIGSLSPGDSLNNCLNTGDPVYCALVRRDVNGSLSVGNGPAAGRVIGTGLNTGSYEVSGIDLDGRYVLDTTLLNLQHAGKISFQFTGSVAVDNVIQVVPGRAPFDCTGLYGPTCTGEGPTSPVPKWRHKLRTTWDLPSGFELSLNWRHIGSMASEFTSKYDHLQTNTPFPIDSHVPSYDYFDLDVEFDLNEHINLRAGVNNMLDKQPPIVGFSSNPLLVNGNMLASMYDTYGRYLFVGFTAKY